jgi:hypothetical protein
LKESSGANNWHAAQKKLRERFQARNGNTLVIVRRGEVINFGQSTDFFLAELLETANPETKKTVTPTKGRQSISAVLLELKSCSTLLLTILNCFFEDGFVSVFKRKRRTGTTQEAW